MIKQGQVTVVSSNNVVTAALTETLDDYGHFGSVWQTSSSDVNADPSKHGLPPTGIAANGRAVREKGAGMRCCCRCCRRAAVCGTC